MRALNTATTGMQAQSMMIEVIAHNLANSNTTGFKQGRADFADLIYQDLRRSGSDTSQDQTLLPNGLQIGLGVRTIGVSRILEQGALQQTDKYFDLAVNGRGYFAVELPNGEVAYTRDGSFSVNENGEMVTSEGYLVQPGITIPQDAVQVTINNLGAVSVKTDGQVEDTVVGQITLVNFINEGGLEAQGNNLFLETASSGTPVEGFAGDVGFGEIKQGYLEASNVDTVTAVTDLIKAQRTYEINSQIIRKADEMLARVSQLN
jgi:flagellar basal-body rod protein FlgG